MRRVIVCLLLAIGCAVAQQPLTVSVASLTVVASERQTMVSFTVSRGGDRDTWYEALQQSVPCPITETPTGNPEMVVLFAHCDPVVRRPLQLQFEPLRAALAQKGFGRLSLWISEPETFAPLSVPGLRLTTRDHDRRYFGSLQVSQIPTSVTLTPEPPGPMTPFALCLAALLVGAVACSYAISHRALTSVEPPSDRWFRLYLWITLRVSLVWLGTWLLMELFAPGRAAAGVLGSSPGAARLIVLSVVLLSVIVANLLCSRFEAPCYREVRGLNVPVMDIIRIGLGRDIIVSAAAIAVVLTDVTPGTSPIWTIAPVFAVIAIVMIASSALRRTVGMRSFALSQGPLRDAVFALAERGRIRLSSLYVLPATKWKLMNAFAAQGSIVMLSEPLVASLSTREVDALVAHELTHVSEGHLRKIGMLTMAAMIPIIFGLLTVDLASAWNAGHLLPVGIALILFLVLPAIRRRYEWRADRGAVALTGDPEAFISGLVRLTRLNCLPLVFPRPWNWIFSHPSTLGRVQAIARRFQVEDARLQALIADGLPCDEHYPIPPGKDFTSRIFNSETIRKRSWHVLLLSAVIIVGGAAATGYVTHQIFLPWTAFMAACAGALAIPVIEWLVINAFAGGQDRALGARLRAKLSPPADAIFVGLSPSADFRYFEGRPEWDAGFLWIDDEGMLHFRGELSEFQIAAGAVIGIGRGTGPRMLAGARNVLIQMPDRTFSLRTLGHTTSSQGQRDLRRLQQRLSEWAAPVEGRQRSTEYVSTVPADRDVTSQNPRSLAIRAVRAYLLFPIVLYSVVLIMNYLSLAMALAMWVGLFLVVLIRVGPLFTVRKERFTDGVTAGQK